MDYIQDYKLFESQSDGLLLSDILDGLKSGKIKIDEKKHNYHEFKNKGNHFLRNPDTYYKNNLIHGIEQVLEFYKENPEIGDKYICNKIDIGQRVSGLGGDVAAGCMDCSGSSGDIIGILTSQNEITLMSVSKWVDIVNKKGNYIINKSDIPNCKCYDLIGDNNLMKIEIDVPDGDLIFSNIYRDVGEEDVKDYLEGINCITGRIKVMNHLASKNIAYAQMGNMSCGVYVNDTGNKIIIGDQYDEDGEFDDDRVFPGFKLLGTICLDVWRWMCADKKILIDNNVKIPSDLKPILSTGSNDFSDFIWAKVQPGRWIIEHYYDLQGDRPDGIYSKLYLKK